MQPIKNKPHHFGPASKNQSQGFTLIEVMVIVVIVGILAAVAYPTYQFAIRKAKRSEGKAALMQLMQQEERYYSQNTTYITFSSVSTASNEKRFKWFSADNAASSAYEINAAACENDLIQNCVKLTATPGTEKVNASFVDSECGSLSFTSTGLKSANAKNCW